MPEIPKPAGSMPFKKANRKFFQSASATGCVLLMQGEIQDQRIAEKYRRLECEK
jgi:hypothetical protein